MIHLFLKEIFNEIINAYSYLHPNYWKRKLLHLIFVTPMSLLLYILLYPRLLKASVLEANILGCISLILTIVGTYFYPFSLHWYKQSLIGKILNNIYHIGGFFEVLLKLFLTVIGGKLIAGLLSPITGILWWRRCVKKNTIIGDPQDFE